MPVTVPNITIYAGDDTLWPVYVLKSDVDTPINLEVAGWSDWAAQWRPREDSTEAVDLVVDDTRADEGIIQISATSEQTQAMGVAGVWDLQAVNDGKVKTWLRGKTKYTKDVTRG